MSEIGAHKPIELALSEQPLSDKEKALVKEAYGRLEVFEKGCAEYHKRARDARKIILLQDPYQDEFLTDAAGNPVPVNSPTRKIMQVQTLKSTYNHSVSDQMDNMPEAIMMPERPELQEMAEDLTDGVRFVLTRNRYEQVHHRRVKDFLGPGTAVTEIVWDPDMDYGKGNIALIRWPVENFLWDPMFDHIQDGRAAIKVSWYPLSWYAAHYPKQAPYVKAENNQHNQVGMPASQMDLESGDEGRAMLMEYWYRRYNVRTRRYSVSVAYLAGGALLMLTEALPFPRDARVAALALVLGAQNGLALRYRGILTRTTHMTGHLTDCGAALGRMIHARSLRGENLRLFLFHFLCLWFFFFGVVMTALSAAWLERRFSLDAIELAALCYLLAGAGTFGRGLYARRAGTGKRGGSSRVA